MTPLKKIAIATLLCLTGFAAGLHAQGIVFTEGTYEQIKEKAARENKKIFVDIYTSWCGPCKQMAANVFPDQRVGEFFNARFVSVKLDAEKQASHGLFAEHKAAGYPTYLWLDANGKLLDKKVGSCSAEQFIEYARQAMTSNLALEQQQLKARWEAGERSLELVNGYVLGVLAQNQPQAVRPAIIDYLNSLNEEELKSYPVFQLILGHLGERGRGFAKDRIFEIFLQNFDYYEDQYASVYDTSIPGLYNVLYRTAVKGNTASFLSPGLDMKAADKAFAGQMEALKTSGLKYPDMASE